MPDVVPQVGSSKGWRIYTIGNSIPSIDPVTYRLRVEGLVERPVELSLADLRDLPRAEQVSTSIASPAGRWTTFTGRASAFATCSTRSARKPQARWLRFVSEEVPYTDSLSVPQALLPDAMLALDMDGAPLSEPHGAPVRVVMPQMYGYKSVKWVTRIEVRRDFVPGFWETHGYDSDAWIGRSNGLTA